MINGFLAVVDLDLAKDGGVFRTAASYAPELSKFVKIAQMIVLQRAVVVAEDGEVQYPGDLIDEMRERFMVKGARSAFAWACRLRTFAKREANCTTSLGYMTWSDDRQTITYKDIVLRLSDFKDFIRTQVQSTQGMLEQLFLLHDSESREDVVPRLHLHKLVDNHNSRKTGWSFLKEPANADQFADTEGWLMKRVLTNEWLRDEFVVLRLGSRLVWKKQAEKEGFSK